MTKKKTATEKRKSARTPKPSAEAVSLLESKLTKAKQRIASLKSELKKKDASISHLLSEDAQSNVETAELKELVWKTHREFKGDCNCNICSEVELSRDETGDSD